MAHLKPLCYSHCRVPLKKSLLEMSSTWIVMPLDWTQKSFQSLKTFSDWPPRATNHFKYKLKNKNIRIASTGGQLILNSFG